MGVKLAPLHEPLLWALKEINMLPDYQIKIIMLMHELENTFRNLYELLSERFPEHNNLWQPLIKEEKEHGEAVRTLYKLTYEGESYFDEGRIKPDAIQAMIVLVKDACDRVKQGKFTAFQALTMTYDLESSLIAKDIFSHFEVSEQFAEMLKYLRDGSENHAQLAKDELSKFQTG
jgi:hypothetical protein